jgi:phage terminase large subunit
MNDFKYKPTTAFWKIQKLLSNKENDFVIQGGQGASKTISILMLLIDLGNRTKLKEISIISDELSKMKRTVINDFLKIIKDWNIQGNWNKSESKFYFDTKSYIEFLGLDVHDVGKGMRRDVVYGNEANKMTFEAWRQIASRAKKRIIDFNPDAKFWGHDLITDNNFLNLTFLDNEYLPEPERNSILEMKAKALTKDGKVKNDYWHNKWRVYGLGEIGSVEGRIYYWNKCDIETYNDIDAIEYIGVDWGKVDPFAVVGVKYHDGKLYVHEYNYDSENIILQRIGNQIKNNDNEPIVNYVFQKANIPKDRKIITDSNYKSKVKALWDGGWTNAQGVKNKLKIIERIAMLQELDVYYTETSSNIEMEQYNSCWSKDRAGNTIEVREDINNHTLDAIEYIVVYMKINKIMP